MFKAEFELEAITPIFMRGTDQKQAEIRSASIKGLMRWWFRALAGNYFGDNIVGLREAENYVFGSTGGKSKVTIKLEIIHKKPLDIDMEFDNWTEAIVWSDYIDYFWAFAVEKRVVSKGHNKRIMARLRTPAYDSGTRFLIKLNGYDEDVFRIAEYSLWTLIYLGGIGFRNRKFGGSLSVISYDGDSLLPFIPKHRFNEYISSNLSTILVNIKDALENIRVKTNAKWKFKEVNGYPKYPSFIKGFNDVFVGNTYSTWIKAIDAVGRWYLGLKQKKKFVDGFRFRQDIANRRFSHIFAKLNKKRLYVENEKRPYLGLPINYFNYKTVVSGNTPQIQRRASGLIFTVNKGSNGYYPTITVLCYQFLPYYHGILFYNKKDKERGIFIEDGELVLLTDGQKDDNLALVETYQKMIDSLQNEFIRLEVFR